MTTLDELEKLATQETQLTEKPADIPYQFDRVEKLLKSYHANQRMIREWKEIYSNLYHLARHDVIPNIARNSLLIRCEVEQLAIRMIHDISDELRRQKLVEDDPLVFSEMKNRPLSSRPNHPAFLIIHNCHPFAQGDVTMSVKERASVREHNDRWSTYWGQIRDFAASHTSIVPIVILSYSVEESTWRGQDWLYYRVFNHHTSLNDLPAEDIMELSHNAIAKLKLAEAEEFHNALDRYIEVVYPKADLKGQDFVDDLILRLLNSYYSVETLEGQLTPRCVPFYRQPRPVEEILKKLDALVGVEEVRRIFEEIYYQSPLQSKNSSRRRMHMAFVGNPGTGKTTVAQLMADLLYHMGIVKRPRIISKKASQFISPYVGQTAIQTDEICQQALDGVLFIDEAYSLTRVSSMIGGSSSTASQCIDTLIQNMETYADRLVVIFAGYPKPMEEFLNANEGLRSRVPYIVPFRDFTEEELLEIFLQNAAKNQLTVEESAMDALRERLAYERSGENFGNARSVENVFQIIMGHWTRTPNLERCITEAHIRASMPEKQQSDLSSMIGLNGLKKQLQEFESRVRYLHMAEDKGLRVPPMNLHMLFVGNPGTGKTTVAKAIAEDLYQIGILKTNKCIQTSATDIIGSWNTAVDTMKKYISQAIGGILFIDEAYALTEYASRQIGSEVLTLLLTAMEEHKSDLVMIFAGYEQNMREFLKVNPGLASRIGTTLRFEDYSTDELTQMFLTKLQSFGYILTADVPQAVRSVMEYFRVLPGFGNGRFVDTLMDQTITKRATRGTDDICELNVILGEDIPTIKEVLEHRPDGTALWDPDDVSQEARRRTAIHEMGHAIVSLELRPDVVLSSISVSPQALSGGRVSWEHSSDNLTEPQLMALMATALGGRSAERLILGCHSVGCAADFALVKRIATAMLEDYAMGEELGSSDIAPLLRQAEQQANEVLTRRKQVLTVLADRLLQKETLSDQELRDTLGNSEFGIRNSEQRQ